MNKIFAEICSIFAILLISIIIVNAQEEGLATGATRFANGVWIAKTSKIIAPDSSNIQLSKLGGADTSSTVDGKLIIHSVHPDEKNKLYVGYDVEVTQQNEKDKFKVAIKPLSINPNKLVNVQNLLAKNLPNYPPDVIINDGEIVSVEILENKQTKAKLVDFIQITSKHEDGDIFFSEMQPVKDFTINNIETQFFHPDIFKNNEKIGSLGGGASAAFTWIYLPGIGRVVFSLFPQKNYDFQKIGVAENKELTFNYDGNKYKIVSQKQIAPTNGKWYIWIMVDKNYKNFYGNVISIGAVDDAKYLFMKNE